MEKLTKEGVKKVYNYWCSKHNKFHYKYRSETVNGKKQHVRTKSFNDCKEFAYKFSNTELFLIQFRKNWNNYSIKEHRKIRGSKKQ